MKLTYVALCAGAVLFPSISSADVFLRSQSVANGSIRDLSPDGTFAMVGGNSASLWMDGLSSVSLPTIPGYIPRVAFSSSDDGRYIAVQGSAGTSTRGAIFDRVTSTYSIPSAIGTNTTGWGISPNGHTLVGGMTTPGGRRPAIATATNAWQVVDPGSDLGDFADMDASESIAVGYRISGIALRWSAGGTVQALPSLGGPSYAHAISNDGVRIVGESNGQAVVWGSDLTPVSLGVSLANGPVAALCISTDGTYIGGGNGLSGPSTGNAFIWHEGSGHRSVSDILTEAGVNTAGWVFHNVVGISSDGLTFAGSATAPGGLDVNYFARIPAPAALPCIGMLGALTFARRRR